VNRDRGLTDVDPELAWFAVNPWRSPNTNVDHASDRVVVTREHSKLSQSFTALSKGRERM